MATVFWNRNIADEAHQKMKEFIAAGQDVTWIAFAPPGGNHWSVVTTSLEPGRRQDLLHRNVPDECHMIMGEIYSSHGPMRAVAFDPDGNGWSVVSAAKNTVIYRLPFEDDDLWKLSNGNWDDPTAGHSKVNPNGLQAFAFDFTHPEGGNIRAARGGVVHALVKSESGNSWGSSDPCNPGVGNYLVIKHSDATFGVYWHMKKNVRAGERRRYGQARRPDRQLRQHRQFEHATPALRGADELGPRVLVQQPVRIPQHSGSFRGEEPPRVDSAGRRRDRIEQRVTDRAGWASRSPSTITSGRAA